MSETPWWKAAKGEVHDSIFAYVRRIEQAQGDYFDRHAKLESLYDQFSPMGEGDDQGKLVNVQENVIASNVDTVDAAVSTTEVRARILTDGADWSTQRRAKHQELYAEGLGKLTNRHRKSRLAFKNCAKKGVGLVKVTTSRWRELVTEHVPIDDILVPDADSRGDKPPLQLHHIQRYVDKDELAAEYPEAEADIMKANGRRGRLTLTPGPSAEEKITVIHSIRLPIGKKPKDGKKRDKGGPKYVPGREVLAIEGRALFDRPYHKPYYPFAVICWLSREGSFYGISLAERIAGIQRALNKRNWQIDKTLDQTAVITTYFRPADIGAAVKTDKIGNRVAIRGDWPVTPTPPAVHPEIYRSRMDLKDAAFEESGVSRLAAQSHKPAGLDSGRALREYRDQTTQRFAPQEADFEQLELDVAFLELDACKDLGDDAPVINRTSRWKRKLSWADVDMDLVKTQISAASTLNRTSAGREQTLIEWAQAGVISTDEFRRLSKQPDLERSMSLYTAAVEAIEEELEMILDGEYVAPEPYDNLKMVVWRGTAEYHNAKSDGAPEEILDALQQYIDQAAWLESQKAAANQNAGMGAAMPVDPMAAGAAGPPAGQPTAALAPQAMDLMAS